MALNILANILPAHYSHLLSQGVDVVIPGRDEPRPRVVVALGTPPAGAEPSKGRVRVPYEQFLLIYSGKASATDVARLAMNPKVLCGGEDG